jgi:hypothetical protein
VPEAEFYALLTGDGHALRIWPIFWSCYVNILYRIYMFQYMELRLSNLYGIQYVYIIYVYIYIYEDVYKNIGRTCLVAPMLLLSRMRSGCIQLNMNVIRGLVKRAQLL